MVLEKIVLNGLLLQLWDIVVRFRVEIQRLAFPMLKYSTNTIASSVRIVRILSKAWVVPIAF